MLLQQSRQCHVDMQSIPEPERGPKLGILAWGVQNWAFQLLLGTGKVDSKGSDGWSILSSHSSLERRRGGLAPSLGADTIANYLIISRLHVGAQGQNGQMRLLKSTEV